MRLLVLRSSLQFCWLIGFAPAADGQPATPATSTARETTAGRRYEEAISCSPRRRGTPDACEHFARGADDQQDAAHGACRSDFSLSVSSARALRLGSDAGPHPLDLHIRSQADVNPPLGASVRLSDVHGVGGVEEDEVGGALPPAVIVWTPGGSAVAAGAQVGAAAAGGACAVTRGTAAVAQVTTAANVRASSLIRALLG